MPSIAILSSTIANTGGWAECLSPGSGSIPSQQHPPGSTTIANGQDSTTTATGMSRATTSYVFSFVMWVSGIIEAMSCFEQYMARSRDTHTTHTFSFERTRGGTLHKKFFMVMRQPLSLEQRQNVCFEWAQPRKSVIVYYLFYSFALSFLSRMVLERRRRANFSLTKLDGGRGKPVKIIPRQLYNIFRTFMGMWTGSPL